MFLALDIWILALSGNFCVILSIWKCFKKLSVDIVRIVCWIYTVNDKFNYITNITNWNATFLRIKNSDVRPVTFYSSFLIGIFKISFLLYFSQKKIIRNHLVLLVIFF